MGPILEFFAIRLGSRVGLHQLVNAYDGQFAAQSLIETITSRRDALQVFHQKFREKLHEDPAGLTALTKQFEVNPGWMGESHDLTSGKQAVDPVQHPFLAWLVSPEGLAFIWAVASIVMSMFGLPPLPPLPPIPSA